MPRTLPSPGRAVSESAGEAVTSGAFGDSSTLRIAAGTGMPSPSATPCASSAETLASIEITRSRIACTPTLVSSKRNAPTMCFFSTCLVASSTSKLKPSASSSVKT